MRTSPARLSAAGAGRGAGASARAAPRHKTVPHNSDADSAMRFLRNMAESHGGTVPEAQGVNCAVCLR